MAERAPDCAGLQIKRYEPCQLIDGGSICHWHTEVEFTVVRAGALEMFANGESVSLGAGDALFLNASCMHAAWYAKASDCSFFTVRFDPTFLFGTAEGTLSAQYLAPLLGNAAFPLCALRPGDDENGQAATLLATLERLERERPVCWEFSAMAAAYALWALLFEAFSRTVSSKKALPPEPPHEVTRLRQGLAFIHAHYAEKLSLEQIAVECGVSKSECCRLFQRLLRQTPFDYVLRLRVHKSVALLTENMLSMMEIAWVTGFSGASYFSEIFRRYYGCSPTEYRKVCSIKA